jgi:hypothetical protein
LLTEPDEQALPIRFILGLFATWRLTHLLAREDGPADAVVRLRRRLHGPLGELLDCFHCLSMWVAAPLSIYVARRPFDRLVVWLALSGAAGALEELVADPTPEFDYAGPQEGTS